MLRTGFVQPNGSSSVGSGLSFGREAAEHAKRLLNHHNESNGRTAVERSRASHDGSPGPAMERPDVLCALERPRVAFGLKTYGAIPTDGRIEACLNAARGVITGPAIQADMALARQSRDFRNTASFSFSLYPSSRTAA